MITKAHTFEVGQAVFYAAYQSNLSRPITITSATITRVSGEYVTILTDQQRRTVKVDYLAHLGFCAACGVPAVTRDVDLGCPSCGQPAICEPAPDALLFVWHGELPLWPRLVRECYLSSASIRQARNVIEQRDQAAWRAMLERVGLSDFAVCHNTHRSVHPATHQQALASMKIFAIVGDAENFISCYRAAGGLMPGETDPLPELLDVLDRLLTSHD